MTRISELFANPIQEKIEPVIKVGERGDAQKLAAEIGSYVVTPMIEAYFDDMLEHYTDTFLSKTTEIGIWISGYFGSGKSHFAKIFSLIAGNENLCGITASKRFEARIPSDAHRRTSLVASISRINQCATDVLAFNLNTLADSKNRPLPSLLLSQYYQAQGYSSNLIYARVIEAELDKQGRLAALHKAVEARAKRPWAEIQNNLSFYRTHLYAAACEVAPEVFASSHDVEQALREAESGEIYNVAFLVETIMADLKQRERQTKKPLRLMLVLDESGQWISDDQGRLSQLQALVEESAIKGQGKIWIVVTTHGDMGSIYKEAKALEGDFKKIEGRFRFKPALTTENIELVLEDRLFKKKTAGRQAIEQLYDDRGSGVLRDLGELKSITGRTMPPCTQEKFTTYYPFFAYQVHLIPEIVKTLRSKGGRGEQMSGSTRTLLAITQDVLRAGRRRYLEEGLGAIVSFDEVYHNLAGEGEVSPDVRTELSRLKDIVPGATKLTPRVAEVLFLIREIPFIPRTRDNIARLLVEHVDDDLPIVLARIEPELQRLMKAGLVAQIGEEYEFLTGERRTFEEEVTNTERDIRRQELERGLKDCFVHDGGKAHWRSWLDSDVVSYRDREFFFRLVVDEVQVSGTKGDVALKFHTPLSFGRVTLDAVENQSLRPDEQASLFFLSGRVSAFDRDLTRYLAMQEVINNWKGDAHKSEDARKLAQDREHDDLPKLHRKVIDGLKEGIRTGHVVFRGSGRQLGAKPNQTAGKTLLAELANYWPTLYAKFDKVPVRIAQDQKAVVDVLAGETNLSKDVADLRLFDNSGKPDLQSPLLDAIHIHLATEQNAKRRVHGKDLLDKFTGIGFGWDPNAVRVGVAALVRAGAVKLILGNKEYSNPADQDLIEAIRVATKFSKAELVLEETEIDGDVLTEVRKFLMKLAKKRSIDETPAALAEAAGELADAILARAENFELWAQGSGFPLPASLTDGRDAWMEVRELANPVHRVKQVHTAKDVLLAGCEAIEKHATFQAQHAAAFKEITGLAARLEAIEHCVEAPSAILTLLAEFRAATAACSCAEKATWSSLQGYRQQAELELTALLDQWRDEARQVLDDALVRMPDDLSQRGLAADQEAKLASPLIQFRDGLVGITLPAKVAGLPDQARRLVRQLGQEIADLSAPPLPADVGRGEGKSPLPRGEGRGVGAPQRQVRTLRLSEVCSVSRIRNEDEWRRLPDQFRSKV